MSATGPLRPLRRAAANGRLVFGSGSIPLGKEAAVGTIYCWRKKDRAMGRFWTDRDWRINRIMWRFNRSGGFGKKTWQYANAPREMMKIIHRKISLDDHETGLVVYFQDPGTWTLLTSDRLIGETNRRAFNANLRTISKFRADFLRDAEGGIKERPIETVTVKSNCRSCTVSIEGPFKSAPHLGLRNVILMAMRMRGGSWAAVILPFQFAPDSIASSAPINTNCR
jgi:hypothetical protein